MDGSVKRGFPFVIWWESSDGESISLKEILITRRFSYFFITIAVSKIIFFGWGHWDGPLCIQSLECNLSFRAGDLVESPFKFSVAIFTASWFHGDPQHITFVVLFFLIWVQSFESYTDWKTTVSVFFSCVAFVYITCGILVYLAPTYFPDNELFSYMKNSHHMGASVGMMGVLGALSHYCHKLWLNPVMLLIFEYWNRYYNGIAEHVTWAHLMSCAFGFIIYGQYLKLNDIQIRSSNELITAENE